MLSETNQFRNLLSCNYANVLHSDLCAAASKQSRSGSALPVHPVSVIKSQFLCRAMMIGRYSDSSLSSARCTGAELYAKLASARLYHRGRISVGYYKRRHSAVTIKRCLAVATDPLRVNPLEACVTDPFAEQNPLRRTRQITCSPTVADSYAKTERTTLKRYAKRAEYDKQVVHAILDEVRELKCLRINSTRTQVEHYTSNSIYLL